MIELSQDESEHERDGKQCDLDTVVVGVLTKKIVSNVFQGAGRINRTGR